MDTRSLLALPYQLVESLNVPRAGVEDLTLRCLLTGTGTHQMFHTSASCQHEGQVQKPLDWSYYRLVDTPGRRLCRCVNDQTVDPKTAWRLESLQNVGCARDAIQDMYEIRALGSLSVVHIDNAHRVLADGQTALTALVGPDVWTPPASVLSWLSETKTFLRDGQNFIDSWRAKNPDAALNHAAGLRLCNVSDLEPSLLRQANTLLNTTRNSSPTLEESVRVALTRARDIILSGQGLSVAVRSYTTNISELRPILISQIPDAPSTQEGRLPGVVLSSWRDVATHQGTTLLTELSRQWDAVYQQREPVLVFTRPTHPGTSGAGLTLSYPPPLRNEYGWVYVVPRCVGELVDEDYEAGDSEGPGVVPLPPGYPAIVEDFTTAQLKNAYAYAAVLQRLNKSVLRHQLEAVSLGVLATAP